MEKKSEARRKLLEELKELFGPAFGPALEAHGRSFAERLRDDKGFASEARKLFEGSEERGLFPKAPRDRNGHRYYTRSDVERLRRRHRRKRGQAPRRAGG